MFLLVHIWSTTTEMAPYLLLGFAVAGFLSIVIPTSFVEKHLGQNKLTSIVKATLAGIPLPLCSCGVIPVAAGLKKSGASNGATTAFLISTPQTGIDSIMVTYALMGPWFTIFRVGAALFGGLTGGLMVNLTTEGSTTTKKQSSVSGTANDKIPSSTVVEKVSQALNYGFTTLPEDIGRSLIAGIIIAGAISALLPENALTLFADNSVLSMIAMMAAGIPVYVCATSSVPIAAALIAKGISPGAALVFLMTGPATNAASLTSVNKMMGKKCTGALLLSVAATSLIAGYLLDSLIPSAASQVSLRTMNMKPTILAHLAGIVLMLIMAKAIFKPSKTESCCANPKDTDNSSSSFNSSPKTHKTGIPKDSCSCNR